MSDKGIQTVEKRFRVTETLTADNCPTLRPVPGQRDVDHPLAVDGKIPVDTVVYQYFGYTYGVVSSAGLAVTKENGKTPFIEIPRQYLEAVE